MQFSGFKKAVDPTCGTGSFLLALLCMASERSSQASLVAGVERNRDSAFVAWFAGAIAKDLLRVPAKIRIECTDINDYLREGRGGGFDLLVGNPPWITWTDYSRTDKLQWKGAGLSKYEFIEGHGMERSLGTANKDIGPAIILRVLQELGSSGARFGFLFKKDSLNARSTKAFRAGRIPHTEGRLLGLNEIFAIKSKGNFVGGTHLTTEGWIGQLDVVQPSTVKSCHLALSGDGWKEDRREDLVYRATQDGDRKLLRKDAPIHMKRGRNSIEIRHGIKHDCKEVFEITRETAEQLGWECVFPTVKSRHIRSDGWHGDFDLVLVPNKNLRRRQDDLERTSPRAYNYLVSHREKLEARKSRWVGTTAFYSIFGVGNYSFAPYKVAWVRLGWKPRFVVLCPVQLPNGERRPIVPSDHFLFIPTYSKTYANRLASLLNSESYQETLRALSPGGKAPLSKHTILNVDIPTETDSIWESLSP